MLWLPGVFAQGFLINSATGDFQDKYTDFYAPECERSIQWYGPLLRIDRRAPKASDLHISFTDSIGVSFQRRDLSFLRFKLSTTDVKMV